MTCTQVREVNCRAIARMGSQPCYDFQLKCSVFCRTSLGLPSWSGLLLLMLGIADPSVSFVSLHHAFPRSTTAV